MKEFIAQKRKKRKEKEKKKGKRDNEYWALFL